MGIIGWKEYSSLSITSLAVLDSFAAYRAGRFLGYYCFAPVMAECLDWSVDQGFVATYSTYWCTHDTSLGTGRCFLDVFARPGMSGHRDYISNVFVTYGAMTFLRT